MARAVTSAFHKTTLAVEFDPTGAAGTYSTVCGITQWSLNETTQLDETEVPDCNDLSLPMEIQKAVRSRGATASCSGVWALSSHQAIQDWKDSGQTLKVRVTFVVVNDSGAATDTLTLTGDAYLTNLVITNTYGQKMTVSFDLEFDGVPVAALKGS